MSESTYAEQLELAARVTEPAIRRAIEALALPYGSRGLDAGCGIGTHARWLCEAAGAGVTGLDMRGDNLAAAARNAGRGTRSGRIDLVKGSVFDLPFGSGSFDWAWCADTLWPVVIPDPVAVIKDLSRVVKPGGAVALLFWSNQLLLPGYPGLESRLNRAFASSTHYLRIGAPSDHHMRALGWLRSAGLRDPAARTFVAEHQAPLGDKMRESVAFCFSMLWGNLEPHLSGEDWEAFTRICTPGSKDFILDSPDYYCWVGYTLFHARLPR